MGYSSGTFNNDDDMAGANPSELFAENVIRFPSHRVQVTEETEEAEASESQSAAAVVSLYPFEQLEALQAMLNAPHLEAENSMMLLRQHERHQQLKKMARHDHKLFANLEKIELLNTLLSEQPENGGLAEDLQYKKNCLVAQSGLPIEYLQVESLTREILGLNQTLLGLALTSSRRLKFICQHPSEWMLVNHRIEKLKRFKEVLYKELDIQERALHSQLFPPPLHQQMINELRPIWKGLHAQFKNWLKAVGCLQTAPSR